MCIAWLCPQRSNVYFIVYCMLTTSAVRETFPKLVSPVLINRRPVNLIRNRSLKEIVSRELRGVKSGINREVFLLECIGRVVFIFSMRLHLLIYKNLFSDIYIIGKNWQFFLKMGIIYYFLLLKKCHVYGSPCQVQPRHARPHYALPSHARTHHARSRHARPCHAWYALCHANSDMPTVALWPKSV